ncbi:MAG: TIGR03862 family flavoprotein [Pseudomonadota bacterium]
MTGAEQIDIAVIGAGPAGLAAAEVALEAGRAPVLFEAKPTAARKFLMAGKSGLNLTMDEPSGAFRKHFPSPMRSLVDAYGPADVRAWAEGLGEPVFTGSSGRVFPKAMKASPLLRRWLGRSQGVELRTRTRWTGWSKGALSFDGPGGTHHVRARAVVLALGGGSWPRLGSDAAWMPLLEARDVPLTPLRPANMGFDVAWSGHFCERFAGAPVKPCALSFGARRLEGEFTISRNGVEGSAIYALSAVLRDALTDGPVMLHLDLAPRLDRAALAARLARPRKGQSLANHLRKTIGLTGVRAGLLRECAPDRLSTPEDIAAAVKHLPLPILAPRPLEEAISSAGGIPWRALDADLMLRALPGVFCAGEMLDWEAPTGGYLLTGCFATGRHAGRAAAVFARRGHCQAPSEDTT